MCAFGPVPYGNKSLLCFFELVHKRLNQQAVLSLTGAEKRIHTAMGHCASRAVTHISREDVESPL